MTTLNVEVEAVIERPLDSVWEFVVEQYFEHHGRWDPAVVDMVKLTPGVIAVGTRGLETRLFGTRQTVEFEVVDLTRKERFALRNVSGPFRLERSYLLQPGAGQTRLCFSFSMAPRGPMRAAFPLLRGRIAEQVRANIHRIPELVPIARADHETATPSPDIHADHPLDAA